MIRLDYEIISDIVAPNSRVLDLGCGTGELLALLKERKNCRGAGIEIDSRQVIKCFERGVSVSHGDIDQDLDVYPDKRYDYVILNESLQQVFNIEKVLDEALRVGKCVIVGVPNFCHFSSRFQTFFLGTMPVTSSLPFKWFDTPNVRFLSLKDFHNFCRSKSIRVEDVHYLTNGNKVRLFPNLFAHDAIFVLKK